MLIKNPKQHNKLKNINIHYHYSHNMIASSIVTVSYCLMLNMVADSLTKPLPIQKFKHSVVTMRLKA